jgi:hypothetical protein
MTFSIEITGHLDGFAVRYDGAEVAVYPTLMGAETGRTVAREALAQLTKLIGPYPYARPLGSFEDMAMGIMGLATDEIEALLSKRGASCR